MPSHEWAMECYDSNARKLEQLDLNAPFMSTRRLFGLDAGCKHAARPAHDARVPFLWEAAPGVPKETDRARHRDEVFKPPTPPPGRWRPPAEGRSDGKDGDEGSGRRGRSPDDKGDDDGEVVNNGCDGGELSDEADMASLSDSLTVACSLGRAGSFEVDVAGGEKGRSPSPDFMIQRFLPAAAELAASFSLNASREPPRKAFPPRPHYHPRKKVTTPALTRRTGRARLQLEFARQSQSRSYTSSKACGITVFFPWGFKQAFCGFKSSVLQSRASFDGRSSDPSRGAHDGNRRSVRSEWDAGGRGSGEVHRACTWETPGWGLRFLDCHGCDGGVVVAGGMKDGGEKSPRKTACSLPPLRSPTEPWLAHALRSINGRM